MCTTTVVQPYVYYYKYSRTVHTLVVVPYKSAMHVRTYQYVYCMQLDDHCSLHQDNTILAHTNQWRNAGTHYAQLHTLNHQSNRQIWAKRVIPPVDPGYAAGSRVRGRYGPVRSAAPCTVGCSGVC